MPEQTATAHRPIILIANDQEWSSRSLESLLYPKGYDVLRAYTGQQAMDCARESAPDLIIVDVKLPDMQGVSLCEQLRKDGLIPDSTPTILTAPERAARRLRLAALGAGAWDVLSHPIDAEEVTLRLKSYIRAKLDADKAQEGSLLDELTGLYNLRGLELRAHEWTALAFRKHRPIACLVMAFELGEHLEDTQKLDEKTTNALRSIAGVLKKTARLSDVIGRFGNTEFAVLAPDTRAVGITVLARRLAKAVGSEHPMREMPAMRCHAGYEAIPDYHEHPVEPLDMFFNASTALRQARLESDRTGDWIRPFQKTTVTGT